MLLADPCQVRWRHKHAQPAKVRKRKVSLECAIEFARAVVACPDGVLVHADWYEVARIADFQPRPLALPQAVRNLPWADPADHREHERPARLEQTGKFLRH